MRFLFEIIFSGIVLIFFFVPLYIVLYPLYFFYGVKPIFKSERIGKGGCLFEIYKFRSMKLEAPLTTIESLKDVQSFLLPFGDFLRRTGIDEVPQFFNIIKGDMSLVGPRPAMKIDKVLIKLRDCYGINEVLPGITGLAQINKENALSLEDKVKFDSTYLDNPSLFVYFNVLYKTLKIILSGSNRHDSSSINSTS